MAYPHIPCQNLLDCPGARASAWCDVSLSWLVHLHQPQCSLMRLMHCAAHGVRLTSTKRHAASKLNCLFKLMASMRYQQMRHAPEARCFMLCLPSAAIMQAVPCNSDRGTCKVLCISHRVYPLIFISHNADKASSPCSCLRG